MSGGTLTDISNKLHYSWVRKFWGSFQRQRHNNKSQWNGFHTSVVATREQLYKYTVWVAIGAYPRLTLGAAIAVSLTDWSFLPPAYVVRLEGTVFTGVCLSTPGMGVPHLHNTLTGPMFFPGGGGGYPSDWSHVPSQGRYPSQVQMGWPGQVQMGDTPARDGVPARNGVPPPPCQIGQQMEYLIRGGRYASCVRAGLPCFFEDQSKGTQSRLMNKTGCCVHTSNQRPVTKWFVWSWANVDRFLHWQMKFLELVPDFFRLSV